MTDDPPHPITQEHYLLLGRIAVAAGRVEYWAALLAGDLVSPDPDVSVQITAGMPFERMLALISQLVAIKAPRVDPTAAQRFDSIADDAKSAMRERNRLLHGMWVLADQDGETSAAIRTRTRKGPITLSLDVSTSELGAALERLLDVDFRLQMFHLGALRWTGAFEEDESGGQRRILPPWRDRPYS